MHVELCAANRKMRRKERKNPQLEVVKWPFLFRVFLSQNVYCFGTNFRCKMAEAEAKREREVETEEKRRAVLNVCAVQVIFLFLLNRNAGKIQCRK